MIETFRWLLKRETSISINGFLYFLKKIPFIGKLFRSDSFHYPDLKSFFTALSFVLSILKSIVKSALAFGITILLMWLLLGGNWDLIEEGIQVAIFFLYFCFGITSSKVLTKEMSHFYNICVFKVNPTSLGLSLSLMGRLIQCFGRTIIFILLLPIFKVSMLSALLISLMCFGGEMIGEAVYLWIFRKTGKTPTLNTVYIVLNFFLIMILGTIFLKLEIYADVFTHPISICAIAVLTVLSWNYLLHYDYYTEAFLKVARREFYDIEATMKNATFASVTLKDSDFERDNDTKQSKKHTKNGYPYLNALFFKRHRRMLMKPALIKSGIFVLIFLAGLVIGFAFNKEIIVDVIQTFTKEYTIVPFLLYLLCNSERITRAMFLNCDYSLMRFGFYKEKKALLQMFSLRLRDVSLINGIPTLTLAIGLLLLTGIFAPEMMMASLLVSVMILVLGVFFTIHYLFIYYLFQPYTEELKVKSPMYALLKFIVYLICYMLMFGVDSPKSVFLPVIILCAVLYMIVALLLVYTKAPKTFRVK